MFEQETPEKIKRAVIEALQTDLDKREGSFADDMAGPVSIELYRMYQTLESLVPMFYVDEHSGQYVDMQAAYWNVFRKPGEQAWVNCRVYGTEGAVVPKGTVFLTEDGRRFLASEARTVQGAYAYVPALAETLGEGGNVPPETIVRIERGVPGLESVINPEAAQGGIDEESTKALLARLNLVRQKPRTSGNAYDYEAWALATPGIGAARVFPLWNGPGTVRVVVADEQMRPVTDEVTADCLARIELERPIGVKEVTVESARALQVAVEGTVRLERGAVAEEVRAAFAEAVTGYLREIAFKKQQVVHSKVLLLLLLLDEVADCVNLTLNGVDGNLELSENELPVLGEVVLHAAV